MGLFAKMFGSHKKTNDEKLKEAGHTTRSEKTFGSSAYQKYKEPERTKTPKKPGFIERLRGSAQSTANDFYLRTPIGRAKIEKKLVQRRAEKFARRTGLSIPEATAYIETTPAKIKRQKNRGNNNDSYPSWSSGEGILGGSRLGTSMLGGSVFGGGYSDEPRHRRKSGKQKSSGKTRTIILKIPE